MEEEHENADGRGAPAETPPFLAGGGECGALIRSFDWSRTPLGPPAEWPLALRTLVRIILTSRQPMFVWWGPDLINLYNDPYRSIIGGKHPGALGQPASEVWREIWDETGPRARAAMSRDEGSYDEALLLIMERYGYREETYFTFSYSPVADERGGIGGVFCANTDDTQRIFGERQLALLGELAAVGAEVRTVAEACRAGALALGTNRRDLPFALLYRLDAARGRFVLAGASGVDPGAAIAPETVPVDGPSPWPLADALRDGTTREVDDLAGLGPLPTGDWDEPPTRARVMPIPAAHGAGTAALLVVGLSPYRRLDDPYRGLLTLVVSQLASSFATARAYEEERERAEALTALDRAKTLFFSNVSHEFRTPLTLMLGPLRDALESPDRALVGPELDAAYRNAMRLLRLTNTLLDFSRFEAGRIQTSFEPTDLAELTRSVASVFRSLVEGAHLTYTVDCQGTAGLYVDRAMWEKVVLNLVSNAFKHTFTGAITVTLRTEGSAEVLRVADTGVGIAPEHLPLIFDRFHRVHGARARTHEGTGIGLALVQEVVRIHGGTIEVRSEPGQGTEFAVSMPHGTAHLPADRLVAGTRQETGHHADPYLVEAAGWVAPAEPEEARLGFAPFEPDTRVVLADDNADMRRYLGRLLARHWTVETAPDGEAALELIRARPPDLVLADVMMPRRDGFGLLCALRDDPRTRSVPVILLSARAGEEARIQGLDAGADDYLVKPFAAVELVARIRSQIELSRMRRAREQESARLTAELEAHVEARTQDLKAQTAALEAANRELSAFTYTIAHDLRAPLRTMHRFGDALANEYGHALDETARGYADRIVRGSQKMDQLIRGLLDYSHVARTAVRCERVDVGAVLADVCRLHPDCARHIRVDGPLPHAKGDTVLLYQVLSNLLTNACKFVAPGVTPRVHIRAEPDGSGTGTCIVLQDNGIGIAPEQFQRIFGVFERLHRSEAYEGTGIGLAIAARAAERMGGRLDVTSEIGVGSAFRLSLAGFPERG
ncbi:MAG: ATP-binding protein [Pseudomonadota bacterium]|nr:ATP-binding protein [Pseudomonadota bacterium]